MAVLAPLRSGSQPGDWGLERAWRRRRRLRAELAGHVVHEGGAVAVGVKRVNAVAQQAGHALKVAEPGDCR